MKTIKKLAIASACLWSTQAMSAVVIGQTPPANPYGTYSTGGIRVFDDFRLASNATIKSVSWWEQGIAAQTGTFEILFTAASGEEPSTVLASRTVVATSQIDGAFITKYSVDLATAVSLTAGTNYFLSIYRTDGDFTWAGFITGGVNGVFGGDVASVLQIGTDYYEAQINFGWELNDTAASTPPIPEPASWAMMVAGIGAVGFAMRRRNSATSFA